RILSRELPRTIRIGNGNKALDIAIAADHPHLRYDPSRCTTETSPTSILASWQYTDASDSERSLRIIRIWLMRKSNRWRERSTSRLEEFSSSRTRACRESDAASIT